MFIAALDSSKSKYPQTPLLESMTDLEANNGDTIITLGFELGCGPTKKDKTEQNLRKKHSLVNDNNIGAFTKTVLIKKIKLIIQLIKKVKYIYYLIKDIYLKYFSTILWDNVINFMLADKTQISKTCIIYCIN